MWKRVTKKRWRRVCAKPNFISSKIFNNDLEDVNLRKSNVVLYRLGIAYFFFILNLAKLPRFEVNYDFIKSANGEKATRLFTNTNCLCYDIQKIFIKICFIKLFLTPVFFSFTFFFPSQALRSSAKKRMTAEGNQWKNSLVSDPCYTVS